MGILKYHYTCSECKEEKYSYFPDVPYCVYCNSKNISSTYIGDKKIDKYSEEGMKLTEKQREEGRKSWRT